MRLQRFEKWLDVYSSIYCLFPLYKISRSLPKKKLFVAFSTKTIVKDNYILESKSELETKYSSLLQKSKKVKRQLVPFTTQMLETSFHGLDLPCIDNVLNGTKLFPHSHTIYFPACSYEKDLGKDGYDQAFAPHSPPFLERVISSGRLEFNPDNWMEIGQEVDLLTTCNKITQGYSEKRGISLSVEQKKVYTNNSGWSMTEFRTIVYFHSKPNASKLSSTHSSSKPRLAKWTKTITPTSILLFRYSAVTFNSHFIHYDPKYCQEVENYPACLVHGPLICTLVLRFLCQVLNNESRTWFSALTAFDYKLIKPLFVNRPFNIKMDINSDSADIWIEDNEADLTFKGRAKLQY